MDPQALRVYWRPGCSSCVKVKEFLSQLGVDYQSINVSATPEAMDELREMGVRTVPVVARGREYVFAQALEDVSRFLGREMRMKRLPPAALVQKWLQVLAAAQRHPSSTLGRASAERGGASASRRRSSRTASGRKEIGGSMEVKLMSCMMWLGTMSRRAPAVS